MKDNEEMLIRLQLKNPTVQNGVVMNLDLNQLREQKQQEFVETLIGTAKIQMLSEIRAETALQIKKASLANAAPPVDTKPLEQQIELVKASLLKRLDLHEKSIQEEHSEIKTTAGKEKLNAQAAIKSHKEEAVGLAQKIDILERQLKLNQT